MGVFGMLYCNHDQPVVPYLRSLRTAYPDHRRPQPGMARGAVGIVMKPDPITLSNLSVRRGGRLVLHGLSRVFAPGSLTAVTGPNGAGKSTLLLALNGAVPVASGWIDRGTLRARDISLLAQDGRLDRGFPVSCRDVVALGWTTHLGLFRRIGAEQYAAADRALAAVGMAGEGLAGVGARPIGALSAGQFQRVLFARTIIANAPVILLDEPFAAIDEATQADLMDIILAWHREGRTILAVLHDQALIDRAFPDKLALTANAQVLEAAA